MEAIGEAIILHWRNQNTADKILPCAVCVCVCARVCVYDVMWYVCV